MNIDNIYIETDTYERDGTAQELIGFDEKYNNIVDYILKITEEIWEKRAIWVIRDTYEEDVIIHTGARIITGIEAVIFGTMDTLASFPDRKMPGEAVIWSKEGVGDFYSSHRIGSSATNLGKTLYGSATGKKIFFRTIADCKVKNNKIYEEWLVRDNLYILKQLGFDPTEMAKKYSPYNDPKAIKKEVHTLVKDSKGILEHVDHKNEPERLIYDAVSELWGNHKLENTAMYYDDHSVLHAICAEDRIGTEQIKGYIAKMHASFEKPIARIERISSNRNGAKTEIAVRWHIAGKTTENGVFGSTSKDWIFIPIISHFIVKNQIIAEEWLVYDGFDALCQIYRES